VADALEFGGWSEKLDQASGRHYYVHVATKRTTWDLAKELGLARPESAAPDSKKPSPEPSMAPQAIAPTVATEAANPRQVGAVAPTRKAGVTSAAEAIASGLWTKIEDHHGRVVYRNPSTNESTGNLDLYLQIKAALQDDPWGSPALSVVPPDVKTQSKDQIVDDRIALVLNAPGASNAAKRMLQQQLDTDGLLAPLLQAQDRLLAEQQRSAKLADALRAAEETAQRLREEVHQLQCALFFGLGDGARGYNPPGTHAVTANTLLGGSASESFAHQRRGAQALSDTNEGFVTHGASARVMHLEAALHQVQEHNRILVAELEQERTSKHFHASCGRCLDLDPWQRLIRNTVGTETAATRVVQASRTRR
jgi:hypothetical protein